MAAAERTADFDSGRATWHLVDAKGETRTEIRFEGANSAVVVTRNGVRGQSRIVDGRVYGNETGCEKTAARCRKARRTPSSTAWRATVDDADRLRTLELRVDGALAALAFDELGQPQGITRPA